MVVAPAKGFESAVMSPPVFRLLRPALLQNPLRRSPYSLQLHLTYSLKFRYRTQNTPIVYLKGLGPFLWPSQPLPQFLHQNLLGPALTTDP